MSERVFPDPHNEPTIPFKSPLSPGEAALPADGNEPQRQQGETTTPGSSGDHSFIGKEFGNYEIVEVLGRGGMGVVYKAVQKKPKRTVALKMILSGRLASQDDLQRFMNEAEASARLEHRNIITVFEVGENDGHHFFSMEFVEGKTLSQMLETGPLPSRKAARYIMIAARALQYAHEQGFLHRDLKPSNIMVDSHDQPRVMDFGLAKRVGDPGQTQSGAILGTPSYMSPEQAGGKVKEITAASDIYGLGAVLYELLTGKPPFRSETHLDTLLHVLQSEPVPPRLLNAKVDTDLETICLKCLEKDPKNRYASAAELADDLQRYIKGESINARSFNVLDRLARALDRGHHDVAFRTWGNMLFWLAAIIFSVHLLVFVLAKIEAADIWLILARFSQFALLGVIFWYNRSAQLLPRTAPERELWTIWGGYLIAYGASWVIVRSLMLNGILVGGEQAPAHWHNLILYPFSSLLSGLAFFVMGSNYWGRCYAIGLAFLVLAMISTLHIEWAPLEFGLLWAVALVTLGWRLKKIGKEEEHLPLHADKTTPKEKAEVKNE